MRISRIKSKEKLICPVCNKEGNDRSFKIWHFENCGNVTHNKGANNRNAKKILIYNAFGFLVFVCNGNFKQICEKNNIPYKPLSFSYKNGGIPIMMQNLSKQYAARKNITHYIGWYALISE